MHPIQLPLQLVRGVALTRGEARRLGAAWGLRRPPRVARAFAQVLCLTPSKPLPIGLGS